MKEIVIFWCRREFRLQDNPSLYEAMQYAKTNDLEFLPIFILDTNILLNPSLNIGHPRKYYLSKIIGEFSSKFKNFTVFKTTDPKEVFTILSGKYKLKIFANFDIEPYAIHRDKEIKALLEQSESSLKILPDQLSIDYNLKTTTGNFYSVFTPFRNAVFEKFINVKIYPLSIPNEAKNFTAFNDLKPLNFWCQDDYKDSQTLSELVFKLIDSSWILRFKPHVLNQENNFLEINLDSLFPRPDLGIWYFNEEEALSRFDNFVSSRIEKYRLDRDFLEMDFLEIGATSRISPALKWGLVSARTLTNIVKNRFLDIKSNEAVFTFISELIWREFYKYLLFHNPKLLDLEFQIKYQNKIEWVDDLEAQSRFVAWIKGETGYKLVDACMNQIKGTGWMHNRGRMVVGSVLCKNLGVDWRWGQDYFRALLVDLDEASNNGGWQWSASTGADPKPIRIFNPYLQAKNYDSSEKFVKLWLPQDYNITTPIIEHTKAREEALKRYGLVR